MDIINFRDYMVSSDSLVDRLMSTYQAKIMVNNGDMIDIWFLYDGWLVTVTTTCRWTGADQEIRGDPWNADQVTDQDFFEDSLVCIQLVD
jgi:hypothetical protein